MKKIADFIVKYNKVILAVFIALVLLFGGLIYLVYKNVNYDITSYLPKDYNTAQGYEILNKYFNLNGDVEIGLVATEDTAKEVAEKIKSNDGVSFALWYDDLSKMENLGLADTPDYQNIVKVFKTHYDGDKYNYAFLVALKDKPSTPKALETLKEIKSILSQTVGTENYHIAGMTQLSDDLYQTTLYELLVYLACAGAIVIIILLLTTSSLTEPIVLAITMVVSIILNLGSNIIFPSTSILTFACSAVLQLSLSMDYAIFLSHAYKEKLKHTLDPKEAMRQAIPETSKAIIVSALTTIGGFLALLVMKFGFGGELGLVLAKGIILSLLSVIFLQPALMLMTDKGRQKTTHRSLDIRFRPLIKRSIKWKPVFLAILIALAPAAFYVQQFTLNYSYIKFMDKESDGSEKEIMAQTLANEIIISLPIYGNDTQSIENHYLFVSKINKLIDDEKLDFCLGICSIIPYDRDVTVKLPIFGQMNVKTQKAIELMVGLIQSFESSGLTINPDSTDDPDLKKNLEYMQVGSLLIGGNYTVYTIALNKNINPESDEAISILNEIQKIAEDIFCPVVNGNKIYTNENGEKYVNMTGVTQLADDFKEITPTDFMWVTTLSVVVIFVLISMHLKSVKLSAILVLLIEFGIWLNLAMQHIFAGGVINFISYMIIGAIQLGSTVDYAILIASKYKKLRERFKPRQAAYMATSSSTTSVLTSASIMAGACLSVYFVSSNLIVKEITFLIARSSIIAALIVIFFLPAILCIFDRERGDEINFFFTPKLRKISLGNIRVFDKSKPKKNLRKNERKLGKKTKKNS